MAVAAEPAEVLDRECAPESVRPKGPSDRDPEPVFSSSAGPVHIWHIVSRIRAGFWPEATRYASRQCSC